MVQSSFDKMASGMRDAIEIGTGLADPATYRVHVPKSVNVKAIRRKAKLTQAEFAARYGFSLASVRDWEQGRSAPDGAARAYLVVIAREPDAVARALSADDAEHRLETVT